MANVSAPAQNSRCEHESGMFCKRKIRNSAYEQSPLTQRCVLCNIIYAFWKHYADSYMVSSKPSLMSGSQLHGQHPAASSTENLAIAPTKPTEALKQHPLKFSEEDGQGHRIIVIKLESKQIGEAYHALICGLIFRDSPNIRIRILFEETQDIKEIRDLFDWYRIDTKPRGTEGVRPSSKKLATKYIAAAFRSSNNNHSVRSLATLSQPEIFSHLRRISLSSGADLVTSKGLNRAYFEPTYAAKYWLNRYLSLTEQEKLPKKAQVSRLALIHIRRWAKTLVGRVMDNENLKHVAKCIAHANKLALKAKESPFTHIMLYGDFNYSDIGGLKRVIEDALQLEKPANKGKTRLRKKLAKKPTKEPAENHTEGQGKNREVAEFWKKFRNFDFDYLPIQVKTLAIWNTLCKRYHPKMCVIGHRSGFIEGAGFIGIPIFYLNNEREKLFYRNDEQGKDEKVKPGPGELLWRTVENPKLDRLRELADVMNTFIPIEALKSKPTDGVFRVEEKYENELTAALFMYMCCDIVCGLSVRSQIFWDLWPGENPGWAARVDMIHHKCEGHKSGEKGCEDTAHLKSEQNTNQTGQEWLRRRYLFATSARKVRLSAWTGIMMGKWTSEDHFDTAYLVRGNSRSLFEDPIPRKPRTSSRLELDWAALELSSQHS